MGSIPELLDKDQIGTLNAFHVGMALGIWCTPFTRSSVQPYKRWAGGPTVNEPPCSTPQNALQGFKHSCPRWQEPDVDAYLVLVK